MFEKKIENLRKERDDYRPTSEVSHAIHVLTFENDNLHKELDRVRSL